MRIAEVTILFLSFILLSSALQSLDIDADILDKEAARKAERALNANRGIIHNDVGSYPDIFEENVRKRSMGNPIWQDVKLANELQLIEPQYIRVSTLLSDAPDAVQVDATYTINAPDNLIINNNDVVNLTFCSSKPRSSDWIGAYSPASITDYKSTVPVKYGYCDEDTSYINTGCGFLTFNFTNLRADIKFVMFINGTSKAVAVATSNFNVSFYNFNQPLRPRVVATGNTDKYNLIWSSYNSTKPRLHYGPSSNNYIYNVEAKTSSITKDQMCGKPANTIGWRELGLLHTATFSHMNKYSNQKLYYRFGDEATKDYSEEFTLQVAPYPGTQPKGRGTRVILYDDLGRGSRDMTMTWYEYGRPAIRTAEMVAPEIAEGNVDAVYHGGDISYATGYVSVWDFFANMMSPVTSGALYLTTVGNHETDWPNSPSYWNVTDSGGECGVVTTTMYTMPEPATTNKPWWSYDVGIIHFVGMSTEHNFTTGSEQWRWLRDDLQNVDRSVTPWVIFGGHRAMYLNSDYCCGSSSQSNPLSNCKSGCSPTSDYALMWDMVKHIEPLLFKYKVNFAFYGHNHVVQRQTAVYNYSVIQRSTEKVMDGKKIAYYDDPQATVHFVIGTGGATFTKSAFSYGSTHFPAWNEKYFYEYGYARVVAVNASYLEYEWVLNLNGTVLDRATIYQKDAFASFNGSESIDVDDDYYKPKVDEQDDVVDAASWITNLSKKQFVYIIVTMSVIVFAVLCLVYYKRRELGLVSEESDEDYQDFVLDYDSKKGNEYSPLHTSASANDLTLSCHNEFVLGENDNLSPGAKKSSSYSRSEDSAFVVSSVEKPSGGMKKVSSFEILPQYD